jgi:hypothetical protein
VVAQQDTSGLSCAPEKEWPAHVPLAKQQWRAALLMSPEQH